MASALKYIKWFKDIRKEDLASVGGKGANLGEMVAFNIPVPPGFVVTTDSYFYFLEQNNLQVKIDRIIKGIDRDNPHSFLVASGEINKLIMSGRVPKDLALEIMKSYLDLGYPEEAYVAVRSSATAEDLPSASFAGQQASFLNIRGESKVVRKVQECWASLFSARAIFYRFEQKIDQLKVGIAVPIQKMVQSEISGVMFTIDPLSNEKNRIVVEAIYGLGELIVQGEVTPDSYVVNKKDLEIVSKKIAEQAVQLIKVGNLTKKTRVSKKQGKKQKLTDREIVEVARLGRKIHQHYFFPQDIEWGIQAGKIYMLQTRPVTTIKDQKSEDSVQQEEQNKKREVILSGTPASPGIAAGPVKIIQSAREIAKIKKGEILVTSMTTPDFVPAMKKAVAIVTDRGGQTSHAAIVSRELGVPCVVGTQIATKILKNGHFVTVNGKTGEVYRGGLGDTEGSLGKIPVPPFSQNHPLEMINHFKTATKIYVNLAEPELASLAAQKNIDGVGLLRAEFMMAEIGVHPKKLIHDRKQKLFIEKLVDNMNIFCEQLDPKPVIYRASDFKTNEYRNLIGGKDYEPEESNPLLGYRGAFRYLSDPEVFELELEAIKQVRKKHKNLHLMIPFVHTPWELSEVKKIIGSTGLLRSSTFKLFLMVEIPSNVILLEDFVNVGIDGVSIGSNDLTMLILGIDRDNSEIASVFNELDPAVLWAIEKVIKICHKYHITSSICGQAPSTYPELVEKLVEWGITSISVNLDAVDATRELVYQSEEKLIKRKNG